MKFYCLLYSLLLISCSNSPPKNTENICAIFTEKQAWFQDSKDSFSKWKVPIPVLMAIMHQESHFVSDAQPPRPMLIGIIPWFRNSSAYGYAQAQDAAWEDYLDQSGNWGADRDDFADAIDFIGWYCHVSHSRLNINKMDAAKLYLAYHEGHGGYQRQSYLKKHWLLKVSIRVEQRASQYAVQLHDCIDNLESTGWFF